jgi:hypothetical protein
MLLGTSLAWLTGCGGVAFKTSSCPREAVYTPAFQDRLADEVSALKPDAALVTAMVDYGRLRAEVLACR